MIYIHNFQLRKNIKLICYTLVIFRLLKNKFLKNNNLIVIYYKNKHMKHEVSINTSVIVNKKGGQHKKLNKINIII